MDQLSGILLHMDLMDADALCSCCRFQLHIAVVADRQVQLGDLIVLWVIRVEIVLSVEFAELVDLTV